MVTTKITVFCNVTPCDLVDAYRRFGWSSPHFAESRMRFVDSCIFWHMLPRSPLKVNRRFGGKFCLHFQGQREEEQDVSRKQMPSSTNLSLYETCALSPMYLYVKGRHITTNIYLNSYRKINRHFKNFGRKLEGKS
jgi:hypothetical protein